MMRPPESNLDLSVRNELADLVAVADALDRVGTVAGFPQKALVQLQVALDEVLSNVVKYAWTDTGAHEFRVRISACETRIEIVVTDDGLPFDPRAQPAPAASAGGVRPRPGGIGIHLVRQLVDGFEYVRAESLNRVTLTKLGAIDGPSQEDIRNGD